MDYIDYFFFFYDVVDENMGLIWRKCLLWWVGGLGGRLLLLIVVINGSLGGFVGNECFFCWLYGFIIKFDEKRLGLDWVWFIGGWGWRMEGGSLMFIVCIGWLGRWYFCKIEYLFKIDF